MTPWVLVALVSCAAPPCHGYAITAYDSQRQCEDAVSSYGAQTLLERPMACIRIDQGTMEILRSMGR